MNRNRLSIAGALTLLTTLAQASEPLPRIFYDAAERSAIASRRTGETSIRASGQSDSPAETVAPAPPRALRLDAIATSASGAAIAWIDGKHYGDGSRLGEWRLHISRREVTLRNSIGHSRTLRVGESLTTSAH